ncbi:MAG: deoxyuridine 5'-triphosphate nucleotidohydrolase [bacterium]|jgi:dUTP pyrophosphatase
MIVSPGFVNILELIDREAQVQGAGVDLSLRDISRFAGTGALDFTNQLRRLPDTAAIEWQDPLGNELTDPSLSEQARTTYGGYAELEPGGYLVRYNEIVEVPPDAIGVILPRSSLMRSGATLFSAVWDPGYRGRGQGLLSVWNPLRLYRNARIGQIFFIRLEGKTKRLYDGDYQGEGV